MFKKVLIANRGVIAVRIERTLRKMGIVSVAVYTRADCDSLHVQNADEAVCIGEGPVRESYLDAELILRTAKETGAEAIHPGYGFLSENAEFAEACEKNGIVFIGPGAAQMRMFSLKHSARELAAKVNAPLPEGSGLIGSAAEAQTAAEKIGYPVMLKSTAGGGGIGMKICNDSVALAENFEQTSYLAQANFKNGGLFVEKYIRQARHVEVQIFGSKDKVVVLGDRDCSVQRRNQKVMEESPAPNIPKKVRQQMYDAARNLARAAGYTSAGTVEFLYDAEKEQFYFLEVNTRLQVEHGVTEEVTGIDLVEWMVREAAGELGSIDDAEPVGHSIQARIYAEDALLDFRPSSGKITRVVLPTEGVRLETWICDNITVSPLYDPMLAKLIVKGQTRAEALAKLEQALFGTKVYGITTNINFLLAFIQQDDYKKVKLSTAMLKNFLPAENALEVIDGGIQTTVQDYPGIIGYWTVGVPPCGPMDSFSFRLGNILLGNSSGACGLELTLRGGAYKFRSDAWFCVTGADMSAALDKVGIEMYKPIQAGRGQILEFAEAKEGIRAYLLIKGGLDVPEILGSGSTFTLGKFGGHGGRALCSADVVAIKNSNTAIPNNSLNVRPPLFTGEWKIGVIAGPHCTDEFLKDGYLNSLTQTKWKVHFNSSRTGVRLIGPTPEWARNDGGEAGLHPSNIHDTAYAIGTLDLTGDMPILLGPDGPSLGGFVCSVTTATAELWKLGQLHPGDRVSFQLLTLEQAGELKLRQEKFLEELNASADTAGNIAVALALPEEKAAITNTYPVLVREDRGTGSALTVRCAGDSYLLVEYGEMALDMALRFKVHALMETLVKQDLPIIEMTPGIRSLLIHIDVTQMPLKKALEKIVEIEHSIPAIENIEVPSRIVKLPLSWNDPAIQIAMERYHKNVRPNAPWCPSNLEFIRRINGLESIEAVREIIFAATYIVLGLGDVYLGAPVTTTLDPRHRLVTTKYNPARTWTPENAVGIGGAYMCVYGMEGPGGYQLFGRTIQMWNPLKSTKTFKPGKPWALEFFDQIQFYPVSAEELLQLREDFLRGRFEMETEATTFNMGTYLSWLDSIKESAGEFKRHQQAAFDVEKQDWKNKGLDKFISESETEEKAEEEAIPKDMTAVYAAITGVVWKIAVTIGQAVKAGDPIVIEESMKMEITQPSPRDGVIEKICIALGTQVNAGQLLAIIK
ncbi:urea carboxylase [Treponema primitia]|uniref:urea carboxylase n=1 Tax=Treponema primitia TaxID=88058 RepID=UPI0002554CC9|nr:urea carboxylase [Treponema primitia]